jgi:hypothetical protein
MCLDMPQPGPCPKFPPRLVKSALSACLVLAATLIQQAALAYRPLQRSLICFLLALDVAYSANADAAGGDKVTPKIRLHAWLGRGLDVWALGLRPRVQLGPICKVYA